MRAIHPSVIASVLSKHGAIKENMPCTVTAQLVEMETRNDLLREARTTLATANPMWIEVMAVLSPESIACQVRAWHGVVMQW